MSTHRAVEKALDILMAFTPRNQEMGTVELSEKMGFHKSTVSRLLHVLTGKNFLQQNAENKKFTLGPAVIDLARALNHALKSNLVLTAKPFIDKLRDTLKETVILEVLSGKTTYMAYLADGPRLIRLAGSIGDRVPIYAAAGAKAILAFSPAETREALLGGIKFHAFTKHSITDKAKLRRQLNVIKARGFAFDGQEIDEGTSAVGAPIFNHEEKPVAAVVVAGPSQRITENPNSEMVIELKRTAAKISTQLYYRNASS